MEEITLLLRSFEQDVEVRCLTNDEAYATFLSISEVPGEGEVRAEMDGTGRIDGSRAIKMHIKVRLLSLFDTYMHNY
jgi:hypothetical protein